MDIPTHPELVAQIDAFLLRHDMAPSRYGRDVAGEPNLVTSIREGREPNLGMLRKMADFMAARDRQAGKSGELPMLPEDTGIAERAHRLTAVGR